MKNKDLKELYKQVAYNHFYETILRSHTFYPKHGDYPAVLDALNKNEIENVVTQFCGGDGIIAWIERLRDFPNLRGLSFQWCGGLGLGQWNKIDELKSLEVLEIRNCMAINQNDLNSIAKVKNLKELRIWEQPSSEPLDYSVLKGLQNLKILRLEISDLRVADLNFVSEIPALEYLLLRGCSHLDVSKLKVHPNLKLLAVPSYTSTRIIKKMRDAGIPAYLVRGYVWRKEKNRFRKEENIK